MANLSLGSNGNPNIPSVALDANAFKEVRISKTAPAGLTVQDKDNLEVVQMKDSIYHFAQTKTDVLPRLMPAGEDFSGADAMVYFRVGHVDWDQKTQVAQATPMKTIDTDRRLVYPILLHTGDLTDMDFERKQQIRIRPAKQLEWTYALSRQKDRYAQEGAVQDVINLTMSDPSGFTTGAKLGRATTTMATIGNAQLKVIPGTVSGGTPTTIGALYQRGDNWLDDFIDSIQDDILDLSNIVLVCHHGIRRHLKKIQSFRDRENTQAYLGDENASMIRYKGVLFYFLNKDVYVNQASLFSGKAFNSAGDVRTGAASNNLTISATHIAASRTMLMLDLSAFKWSNDSGGMFAGTDTLGDRSFASIFYMKAGFAVCRMDELKVKVIFYNPASNLSSITS